jgi:hypothetical protein
LMLRYSFRNFARAARISKAVCSSSNPITTKSLMMFPFFIRLDRFVSFVEIVPMKFDSLIQLHQPNQIVTMLSALSLSPSLRRQPPPSSSFSFSSSPSSSNVYRTFSSRISVSRGRARGRKKSD